MPWIFQFQQKLCNNYDNVRAEFRHHLDKPGQRILDIGCSTGTCAGEVVDMDRNEYYGVDIDDKYTQKAKRLYPHGKFLTMDARKMTFPDAHFDIVMFNGVIHHMPDDLIRDCLKDVKRVLKPEGVVLVSEPVFVKEWWFSTFLLKLDRGHFIRKQPEYKALFSELNIKREDYFRFSAHRFCSFELVK